MDPLKSLTSTDSARKALSLLEEFKNFALKGNVIDLAVGVIIGAAFGKIVDSLVKHILMPTLGMLLPGEQGYLGWKLVVGAKEVPYGLFLGEVVNFVVVALALYLFIVKFLGWAMKTRQSSAAAAPPAPSKEEQLLVEIRDLLKQWQQHRAVHHGEAPYNVDKWLYDCRPVLRGGANRRMCRMSILSTRVLAAGQDR